MDAMLELSEQIRIQRAKDGLPLRQFDPVPVEFVL